MMLRIRLFSAVVLASCVGCGSPAVDHDASVPSDAGADAALALPDSAMPLPLVLDTLPAQLAAIACEGYARCGDADVIAATRCASVETWARDTAAVALARAIDEGRVRADGAGLAACLASLEAADWCDRSDSPADWLAGCDELLFGTVAEGETCGFDWECASQRCAIDIGWCGGECAARLPAGEVCNVDADCAEGLECGIVVCEEPWPPSNIEPRIVGEGEGCDLSAEGARRVCAEGLSCAIDLETRAARCRGPLDAGEACTWAIPDLCGDGAFCDSSAASAGACRTLPVVGEPCLGSGLPGVVHCAAGLGCGLDGTCAVMSAIGEPCSTDRVCWSGLCEAGACVAPSCSWR